eukprot:TRINITY_DN10120_c0_g1_i1.p1 TRINITY_DN10120_c0_g1~~TRINITY_DN10120_c0_g1_i1.p1  ORF type:complete len:363 (-),score=44.44 TRINITY_DN10120_c0_g1_i1:38-1126(-)
MKTKPLLFRIFFIILLSSCSKEEESIVPPSVTNYTKEGVLGGTITIKGENFELEKVQVFFDEAKAQIFYLTEKEIQVIVPRTIKRINPILKVINLRTNKSILEDTFLLKKPVIKSFNTDKISFDENLIIYGENFDNNASFIEVYINKEKAEIKHTSHTKIEVHIPYKLTKSALDIQIKAQLQETTINKQVHLKTPVIETVENTSVRLRNTLKITGKYFNPKKEYGEIYINNVKSHFSIHNYTISITIPHGPYTDFKITNITYKTADLETSFNSDVEILNNGILVDYFDQGYFGDFVSYNNKAYSFSSKKVHSSDDLPTVELFEFTETEEIWKKIDDIKYQGYIKEIIFDNDHSIYLLSLIHI